MFSQVKDIKHIKQDFLFCSLCPAPGVELGGAGGSNILGGGGVAMAPHPLHVLVDLLILPMAPEGRLKKSAVAHTAKLVGFRLMVCEEL